ncbi:MAG: CapA family protein [Clostridia bacterium]|nr:CapA family protein [Clostridia bacterium]
MSHTTIAFTGDIGFDKYMHGKWADPALLSDDVQAYLRAADHVVINVEGPLLPQADVGGEQGATQLLHAMDPAAIDVFNRIGADVWNICNNHIMDAGEAGIVSTLNYAAQHGVATIGAGRNLAEAQTPVILPEAGGIGLFGVGYQRACRAAAEDKAGCYSWSDLEAIRRTIAEIKQTCRWCVIVAHAGEEFTPLPSPYTRERYHQYLEMGADVVVAHHPHVPMNYETVGDKAIFYSLGNFIFDTDYQRAQYNTEFGILLKLNFTPTEFTFDAMGLRVLRGEERVVAHDLPKIFRDVQERDYRLLAPLSARILVEATKRQMAFLKPSVFANATEELWAEHFADPLRTGRVPGETLDFFIICPLAEQEKEQAWKQSTLEDVKEFMLAQL